MTDDDIPAQLAVKPRDNFRDMEIRARSKMIRYYTLGFCLNNNLGHDDVTTRGAMPRAPGSHVVLLQKSSTCEIPFLRGLWNGVGGKLNPHETFIEGMKREWTEETADLPQPDWRMMGTFVPKGGGVLVYCFVGGLRLHQLEWTDRSVMGERVKAFETWHLPHGLADEVDWLIAFTRAHPHAGRFTLDLRG